MLNFRRYCLTTTPIIVILFSSNLKDTDIFPISETVLKEKIYTESDCIGIVFPIYIYGIPSIISRFISKLNESFKDKYIFAVTTYIKHT